MYSVPPRKPTPDPPREARAACLSCAHFYVTWDPRFPRGCRALGFKSRELPCAAVAQASGQDCLYFEPSPRARR